MKHKTRESWIRQVAMILNKKILKPSLVKTMPLRKVNGTVLAGETVAKLPINKIQFSCAYSPNMRVSQVVVDKQVDAKVKAIGTCFYDYKVNEKDAKGKFLTNIFISPKLDKPTIVAGVILHELIHTMSKGHGHKGAFRWISEACGLAFTPNGKGHTYALPELESKLEKIVKEVGTYPHQKWVPNRSHKKQTTRMFKLVSLGVMVEPQEGLGLNSYEPKPYVGRFSRTALSAGFPKDPEGKSMFLELTYEQLIELFSVVGWCDDEIDIIWKNCTINLPTGGRGIAEADYVKGLKGEFTW